LRGISTIPFSFACDASLLPSPHRRLCLDSSLNEAMMVPGRPATADTRIEPGGRLGVLVPKMLSDGLKSARLGIEHHLGAQMSKLMQCENDAGAQPVLGLR
jgi:hypothetical protein